MVIEARQAFLKVSKFTNKGNFSAKQKTTVRDLQKFASVHGLTEFLLETYSEIGKYCVFKYYMTPITRGLYLRKCSYCTNTSQKAIGSHILWFILIIRQSFFSRMYK